MRTYKMPSKHSEATAGGRQMDYKSCTDLSQIALHFNNHVKPMESLYMYSILYKDTSHIGQNFLKCLNFSWKSVPFLSFCMYRANLPKLRNF